ncbi:MAG: zf-HC2 domain-containing protein [Planctomycetota bacterium]
MNCHETIERLGVHLDSLLSEAEAAEVESHLSICAACRVEMDDLRRTLEAVKALPRLRAPRGFAAGVMAEIKSERVVASAGPARVTPIRGFTVFMRLAASIAAICLVWVGVRALRVDPGVSPATGVQAAADLRKGASAEKESTRSGDSGKLAAADEYEKAQAAGLKAAGGRPDAPASGFANPPSPAVPKDSAGDPELAARKGAGSTPEKAAWRDRPDDSANALAVQRITVYSTDVAVDTSQLKKLLSESGYTYSTQKKALLVRVPASEASRLVASLGAMPGGFRAADRQSLDSLERLKKEQDKKAKTDKGGQPNAGENGLAADADDLKEVLRKHIDESRQEIRKQEEGKKANAQDPKSPDAVAAAGGGKRGEGGGAPGADFKDGEMSKGLATEPGNAPAGPAVAGGRPAEEAEEKNLHGDKADDGVHDASKELGDAKAGTGGTDDLEGRARREKQLDEKLSDELRKLEAERKLSDAEDAVVIYIEFEESAEDAKPSEK